jgi:hypothetical protein
MTIHISTILGAISAALALVGAFWWWKSVRVEYPSSVGVEIGSVVAITPEFEQAVADQGRRNMLGAFWTAGAALFQFGALLAQALGH